MPIALITGTRPEIIKMFPLIKQFDARSIDYKYIHTGQHYDYGLFVNFVEEFGIRRPDIVISLDAQNEIKQVSDIMKQVGTVLKDLKPSLVLVQGDTNSVLGAALAALKSHIPIAHVESGLRSNNWKTVEEHNRRIVDHISDILFSPTDTSTKNLKYEHVYGEVHTVGNTIIDAINLCLDIDKPRHDNNELYSAQPNNQDESAKHLETGFDMASDFVLVTMHRSENVDDLNNLKQILMALSDSKLTCLFPMHPHTLKRIRDYRLTKYIGKRIKTISPVGYLNFLKLLQECRFVITDSGGIQEEITSPKINKRALILRDCTERPESVLSGHSVLCKIKHESILKEIENFNANTTPMRSNSPYGTGDSAIKIADILETRLRLD
jgi:UDP-N-acetylglucosamine 2-epimerase (non-hydrolysing)